MCLAGSSSISSTRQTALPSSKSRGHLAAQQPSSTHASIVRRDICTVLTMRELDGSLKAFRETSAAFKIRYDSTRHSQDEQETGTGLASPRLAAHHGVPSANSNTAPYMEALLSDTARDSLWGLIGMDADQVASMARFEIDFFLSQGLHLA